MLGITPERVEKWAGKDCGCKDRQERLNQLSRWAKRILRGKTQKAKEYLEELLTWQSH